MSRLNSVDFELLNTVVPPLGPTVYCVDAVHLGRASITVAVTDITYRAYVA